MPPDKLMILLIFRKPFAKGDSNGIHHWGQLAGTITAESPENASTAVYQIDGPVKPRHLSNNQDDLISIPPCYLPDLHAYCVVSAGRAAVAFRDIGETFARVPQ